VSNIETVDELFDSVEEAYNESQEQGRDPKQDRVGVLLKTSDGDTLMCYITDWSWAEYVDSDGTISKYWLHAEPMSGQRAE
jgi:hypothetical protein